MYYQLSAVNVLVFMNPFDSDCQNDCHEAIGKYFPDIKSIP